jgi:hypothetical protein
MWTLSKSVSVEWEAEMPVSRFSAASYVLALPSCPKCGSRMVLLQIVPYGINKDERSYECRSCGHEVMEVVAFEAAN